MSKDRSRFRIPFAQETAGSGLADGVAQALEGQGVFSPDVEEALLAAGGQPGNGHGFDEEERIFLHEHPVLEGSRLRLVRVADQITDRLGGAGAVDRLPFPPRGKGGPTPSHQLGIDNLANDPLGTQVDGPPQGLITPLGQMILQALGLEAADAPQHAQFGLALLRDAEGCGDGRGLRFAVRPLHRGQEGVRRGRSQRAFPRLAAGRRDQGRRGALAEAEAGAPEPGELLRGLGRSGRPQAAAQLLADRRRPPNQAGKVVTNVNDDPRPRSH